MRRRESYDPEHTTDEDAYEPPRSRRRVEHDEKQPERKVQYTTAENVGAIATGLTGLGMLPPPRPPVHAHPIEDWVHGVLTRSTEGHVRRLPQGLANQIADFLPLEIPNDPGYPQETLHPENERKRQDRAIDYQMRRMPRWVNGRELSDWHMRAIAEVALLVRDHSLPAAMRMQEFGQEFPWYHNNPPLNANDDMLQRITGGLRNYYPNEHKTPLESASYVATMQGVYHNVRDAHNWMSIGQQEASNSSLHSVWVGNLYREVAKLHPTAQRHFLMELPENIRLEMERLSQRRGQPFGPFESYNPDFPNADTAQRFRRSTR